MDREFENTYDQNRDEQQANSDHNPLVTRELEILRHQPIAKYLVDAETKENRSNSIRHQCRQRNIFHCALLGINIPASMTFALLMSRVKCMRALYVDPDFTNGQISISCLHDRNAPEFQMTSKSTILPASLFFLIALVLIGCSGSDDENAPDSAQTAEADSPEQIRTAEIRWFEGTTVGAFAEARKRNKPLFLFWGADWCPDCSQVKATIFTRNEFIVRSAMFIPVYLDGDTDNAQRSGEEFGVIGYPTMIVFSPQGDEITRIPGGIDIERYTGVLDLTLGNIQTVARLVERVSQFGQALKKREYRLLAYYSWEQDNERAMTGVDKIKFFDRLSSLCPPTVPEVCSRFAVERVKAIADAMGDEEDPLLADDDLKNEALETLRSILHSKKLILANLKFVLSSSAEMARAFTDPQSPRRASLLGLWDQALKITAADPQISLMDRLYTSRGRLRMARVDDPDKTISPEFQQKIADHIDWADRQAVTSDERQAVINAAGNILTEAGMYDKATEILTRELEISQSPFYFMTDLAEVAELSGKTEEAIDWLRRAYDESSGEATRVQWGYDYVSGLLRMIPADTSLIENETIRFIGQFDGQQNAFYQRTRERLGKLDSQFREWNADGANDKSIRLIRTKMQTICASIPETDASRTTCDSFLVEA